MHAPNFPDLDLTPPPFEDGLYDWSRGDGTPESATYAGAIDARLGEDPDFGVCLELVKIEELQRLRYMGELPMRPGRFIEISARVKALKGPIPEVRAAAVAGGAGGRPLDEMPSAGPALQPAVHRDPVEVAVVIGPRKGVGVDLVWGPQALYAHVGLDLLGPVGGLVRIENLCVRDVTARLSREGPLLPGFVPGEAF